MEQNTGWLTDPAFYIPTEEYFELLQDNGEELTYEEKMEKNGVKGSTSTMVENTNILFTYKLITCNILFNFFGKMLETFPGHAEISTELTIHEIRLKIFPARPFSVFSLFSSISLMFTNAYLFPQGHQDSIYLHVVIVCVFYILQY